MKIRMKALAAGPDGIMLPGQVYEVAAAEGKSLVEGGFAESMEQPLVKKKTTTPTPTTPAPTGEENPDEQNTTAPASTGEGQEPQ